MEQSVLKCQHINFRCGGFTQKKEHNTKRVTMQITLNVFVKQDCDGLDLCIDEKVSRVNAEF